MSSQNSTAGRNWTTILTVLGTVASIVVSAIAIVVSYWAFDVSERTEGRASGKIKAKFEDLGIFPTEQKFLPPGVKMEKEDSMYTFTIPDLQNFLEWSPSIKIKNIGEYPIDNLHVDVQYLTGGMMGKDVKQIHPIPILGTGISTEEPPMFGKLEKSKFAILSIKKPLLQQMLKATMGEKFKDKEHFGVFEVRTFCRIVGATSYDRPERPDFPRFTLIWTPSHLEGNKIKLILGDQPQVHVMDQ